MMALADRYFLLVPFAFGPWASSGPLDSAFPFKYLLLRTLRVENNNTGLQLSNLDCRIGWTFENYTRVVL